MDLKLSRKEKIKLLQKIKESKLSLKALESTQTIVLWSDQIYQVITT